MWKALGTMWKALAMMWTALAMMWAAFVMVGTGFGSLIAVLGLYDFLRFSGSS